MPEGFQFVQVSAGTEGTSCGVTVEGEVLCWGPWIAGGDRFFRRPRPPFLGVTVGHRAMCARRPNSKLDCFGNHRMSRTGPQWDDNVAYAAVVAGEVGMCGVEFSKPHRVRCWGSLHQSVVDGVPLEIHLPEF